MASDSEPPERPKPTATGEPQVVNEREWSHEQFVTMKAEIDALQIATAEAVKPWYRQASVLIAGLALIFSFATTFYSLQRTEEQDVRNAKIELRDLIQRLAALPIRNLDLDRKYAKDANALSQAGSLVNTENIVLAKQAVDIIDEIPDEATSTEYYAVASALALSGDYGRTRDLYNRALSTAQDANDWTAAARSLAATEFSLGRTAGGRRAFQRALDAFDRFPTDNVYFREVTNSYTELVWAHAEVLAKNCSDGLRHLSRAEQGLAPLGEDVLTKRYAAQAGAIRQAAATACEGSSDQR